MSASYKAFSGTVRDVATSAGGPLYRYTKGASDTAAKGTALANVTPSQTVVSQAWVWNNIWVDPTLPDNRSLLDHMHTALEEEGGALFLC